MALGLDARATFLAIVKGDVSDAVQKFDKLGKSVDKSTGQSTSAIGKFKAFSKGAFGEVTAMLKSPAGMAAAITATGAAALAAANKFSDLAKASIDLGKATGLSTEQSSRWIAVGDDLGVSAETLATGIGRIAKTLDSAKWSNYGIATKDAAGNTRDANDVLLDALDLLGRTESATERARIGTELFGKGFGSLAPLIGKSREEYESMLSSVSEGQVITDGEAAAGEKWRLAMDNLSDSFGDVALSLGEVAVSLAPVVDAVADLLGYAPELLDQLGISDDSTESVQRFNNQIKRGSDDALRLGIRLGQMSTEALENKNILQQWGFIFKAAFSDSTDQIDILRAGLEDVAGSSRQSAARTVLALEGIVRAAENGNAAAIAFADGWDLSRESLQLFYDDLGLTRIEVVQLADSAALAAEAGIMTGDVLVGLGSPSITGGISMTVQNLNHMEEAARDAAWEVKGIRDRFGELIGQIDERQAFRNVQDQFDRVKQLAEEAFIAGAEGADDAEQKYRAYQDAVDDLRLSGIDYADMLGKIPPAKVTEFLTLVNQQKFDEAEALLNGLANSRVVGFQPRIVFGRGGGIGGGGQIVLSDEDFPGMATGGPVSANMPYMVGERGPELFMPATSGTIIPNNALGGGNVTVVINNPVSSGEQIANELAAYVRRNGTRFLTGVS